MSDAGDDAASGLSRDGAHSCLHVIRAHRRALRYLAIHHERKSVGARGAQQS